MEAWDSSPQMREQWGALIFEEVLLPAWLATMHFKEGGREQISKSQHLPGEDPSALCPFGHEDWMYSHASFQCSLVADFTHSSQCHWGE